MQLVKRIIINLLYHSGILSLYHRVRNRRALTVVMFHRILPLADVRWTASDPEWTVTTEFFDNALCFFKKHYHIISLPDLERYCAGDGNLPACPLLITFDDGWSDNYQYALPLLQKHRLPAVVFAVSDSIGQRESFWQDTLWGAWRRKQLTPDIANDLWQQCGLPLAMCPAEWNTESSIRYFISELNRADEQHVNRIRERIFQIGRSTDDPALMLSQEELISLCKSGIAVGSHGQTHSPLARVADPQHELAVSRQRLQELLNECGQPEVYSLSFPHSRANTDVVQLALQAGYRFLFTGGDCINRLDRHHRVFGRFNIHQGKLGNDAGDMQPARMAMYMFRKSLRVMAH